MKKTIISLFAVFCLGLSLFAQNAVQDALKAMPCSDMTELAAMQKALAKDAPQSVIELASMLQPAEARANATVEYALSALSNFGSDPANSKYRKNIRKGFEQAAAAAGDQYNKAFLATQLRLLSPENEAAPVYKSKNIKKYSKLWDKPVKLEKALMNKDRKYRTTALQTYTSKADENTFQTIAEVFPKLSDEAKMDVLNWAGDLREKSMADLAISQFDSKNKELAACAMNAAGKIGTLPVLNLLIEELGSDNDKAAYAALKSFNGDIRGTVAEAFKRAKGQQALNLMTLAAERHVTEAAPKIFRLAEREDGIALDCLTNVVTPKDAKRVAELMDKDDFAFSTISSLQKTLDACLKNLDAEKKYESIKKLQEKASHPERFLTNLAFIGSDQAAKDICEAYQNGKSRFALGALLNTNNYIVAPALLQEAKEGNAIALGKYIDLVSKFVPGGQRTELLSELMPYAKDTGTKKALITAFRYVATPGANENIASFLDDDDINVAISAAQGIKNHMGQFVGKIDKETAIARLKKAAEVFARRAGADDKYAIDEINDLINKF